MVDRPYNQHQTNLIYIYIYIYIYACVCVCECGYGQDSALNNPQELICHKIPTNQSTNQPEYHIIE